MKKTVTILKSLLFICLLTGVNTVAQEVVVTNTNDSGEGSFRQAVADVAAGGTITFGTAANGTITLQSAVTINKNITINGNGDDDTVFSGGGTSQIFVVNNAQMLTINNVGFTNGSAEANGGAIWATGSTIMVNNSAFTGNKAGGATAGQGGGAIYTEGGSLTVNASTFTENEANGTAGSGGAVLIGTGGNFTANGTTFTENMANRAGGAIEGNGGANSTITLNNVIVRENSTGANPGNGGGLHITGAGNTTITGGTVTGNTAIAEGGGLWNGSGTMMLQDVTVTLNTASGAGSDQGGGGIYNLNGGTLSISDSRINNNKADGAAGSGGGILNDVGSKLTITDTEISGNTAARAGGGIEDNSGTSTIVLTNVSLTNNITGSSPGNGGGLHITGSGNATITGGIIRGNSAIEGGGLWNGTGTLTVNNAYITANIARGASITDGGGAIYNNGGTLNVNASTISANTSEGLLGRGGGIHVNGGTATIRVSTISGNTSLANGGGIYSTGTLDLNANTVTLNGATVSGGGIYTNATTASTIKNSIISANTALISGRDVFSETENILSNGYNIIGMDDNDDFTDNENDRVGTLLAPFIAGLLPLSDGEDGLPYHAFDCPSAAADMGDPTDTFNDQFGMEVFNSRRDIGAFEAQEICSTAGNDAFASVKSMVFPNPSVSGLLNVQLAQNHNGDAQIAVYELATGKLLQQAKAAGSLTTLGLQDVAAGTYIVKITSDTATETYKVMVNR